MNQIPPSVEYGLRHLSGRQEGVPHLARKGMAILENPELVALDTGAERALALCVMGLSSYVSYDLDAIEPLLEQSLSLFRALGDSYMAANLLAWLGVRAEVSGDYDKARQRREESLELRRELGDTMGIASSLSSLGFIALMQGRLQDGERLLREASQFFEQLNTRVCIAAEHRVMATAHYYHGRFAEARAVLEESVAIYDELGLRYHQHTFEANVLLGYVNLSLGRHAAALEQGQLALSATREAKHRPFSGIAQLLLGAVAAAVGDFGEANERLREYVAAFPAGLSWPIMGWGGVGQECALLGYVTRGLGEDGQAWRHVREALSAAAERHLYLPLITALPAVALLLLDAGESERAVELYALASSQGYVGNSKWFEDIAGREISEAAATLPLDVVAAAQERGRARDLWETAKELLGELND